MNTFISIILLSFIFSGQFFAQWEKTNFPSTLQVNSLAISDSNIFAGTEGDGIFVSTDNGENWINRNNGLQDKVIHTIFINGKTLPAGQARIYAGTETGAYVSTNKGKSWEAINSGLSGLGVWSFAVSNFMGDSTIFAGTWNGIYSSTNNGANWEPAGLSTTMPVNSIIARDNFMFAATLAGGVYYSQNNGFGWKDISIKVKGGLYDPDAIIPVYSLAAIDTNVIASAGPGKLYYTSFDSGNFAHSTSFGNMPILCFVMHYAKLFAGNSAGYISVSDSYGLAWKYLPPPLTNQAVYSLTLNNSYIFAGTGNGVWREQYSETATNVKNLKEAPSGFILEQNYPNPFNPSTTIKYNLPSSLQGERSGERFVTLKIYNLLGKVVATLVNEQQEPGNYEVKFNGTNLPSGVYLYRLQAGNLVSAKKLMLLK